MISKDGSWAVYLLQIGVKYFLKSQLLIFYIATWVFTKYSSKIYEYFRLQNIFRPIVSYTALQMIVLGTENDD